MSNRGRGCVNNIENSRSGGSGGGSDSAYVMRTVVNRRGLVTVTRTGVALLLLLSSLRSFQRTIHPNATVVVSRIEDTSPLTVRVWNPVRLCQSWAPYLNV